MKVFLELSGYFETELETNKELIEFKRKLKEIQKKNQYISIKVFTMKTNREGVE